MHVSSALSIFAKRAFSQNTNYTIFFVLYLTWQPNFEDFVENIKSFSKVLYYIFINGYILVLKACQKCNSSKRTIEEKSQNSASNCHNALVIAKSTFKQTILACSKQKLDKAEKSEMLAKKAYKLLKKKYVL